MMVKGHIFPCRWLMSMCQCELQMKRWKNTCTLGWLEIFHGTKYLDLVKLYWIFLDHTFLLTFAISYLCVYVLLWCVYAYICMCVLGRDEGVILDILGVYRKLEGDIRTSSSISLIPLTQRPSPSLKLTMLARPSAQRSIEILQVLAPTLGL